ncbi:hypothetical protein ACTQ32_15595 [Roseburia faecis]|uniref:hypothetical protein n=1 Tax=Roseburia faecis TaxID=301302 RepID=UPI0029430B88|nr:hypothetical protein [uncultured Agathobacter sp.]
MDRNDENRTIIEEISKAMKEIDLDDLERKIINLIQNEGKEQKTSSNLFEERKLYKYIEYGRVYLNRIIAINQNVIDDSEKLRYRIQMICNERDLPCDLSLMDMPFNNSIYVVRLFYEKLQEEYIKTPTKYMLLGLAPNIGGRCLKRSMLTDDEQIVYDEINKFLKLVSIYRLYNELIDLCKCIMCNFLNDKKDVSEE